MAISQLDQINKTQEGVRKLRESLPGPAYDPPEAFAPKPVSFSGVTSTVTQTPAVRRAVSAQPGMPKRVMPASVSAGPAQPIAPTQSAGARFGGFARRTLNSNISSGEAAANFAAIPARTLGGFARDAYAGFTGASNPREGKPIANHFAFPRFSGTPRADFSGVTAAVTQNPNSPKTIISDGGAGSPTNPYAKPAAPIANAIGTTGILRERDKSGNMVYSDTAVRLAEGTRMANAGFGMGDANVTPTAGFGPTSGATAGGPTQSTAASGQPSSTNFAVPQRTLPQQVVAPNNFAGQYDVRGRQGGIIRNPDNGSVADQVARAVSGYGLKGSPSSRALVAKAILDEAGYQNDERQSALRTGDEADLAQINNAAQANEAFAQRRLESSKFNVDAGLKSKELDDRRQQPYGQVLRRLDGAAGVLRNDGSLTPITDASGNAFQLAPEGDQRITVSPDAEFKSLSDELAVLGQNPSPDGSARITQIQARMAQLNGTASSGGGAQYPEGLRLTGPDGKRYVVKNGEAVVEK